MAVDLIAKIKSSYNQFTKAEKQVADYVLDNVKDVLFMSITDLAEACNVGETSVFRFCKTLELKGYQEFKMYLSLSISEGQEEIQQFTGKDIDSDDTILNVANKVLNTNIVALTETFNLIKEDDIDKTIEIFIESKRVYFFGVGASMLTAMKAMNKFLRIENKVYCVQDSHMQAMVASTMTEDDLAIVFSHSGATKDTVHVAQVAKDAGAKIVCVTRFSKSPLSSLADVTLLTAANEGPLQGGSTSSEISMLYIIDLLYTEYYRRSFDRLSKNNAKTSASISEKLF
ncbi:MAG: MurR/RpiR family transcriptional regulator [Clostridiales bacterium]|nr:MurR/RpiR family transcriptional regulator [Clostridiales bacterium]